MELAAAGKKAMSIEKFMSESAHTRQTKKTARQAYGCAAGAMGSCTEVVIEADAIFSDERADRCCRQMQRTPVKNRKAHAVKIQVSVVQGSRYM